ncbi:ski oncogene-like [Penaeus monodon]|uniref:ski oncogene-like n=1 Tax=Penaeus monodon TaxID=6687 RepID=UPI0018A7CEC0|nr:ski oncogene-like [Penaeus monodon]
MATQDYTPHLKRVLRSYQSTAMTSLHGPGTIYLNVAGGRGVSEKVADFGEENIKSFKQCIKLYEDSLKNKVEDSPRRCAADDAECRRVPAPSSPPTRRTPTPSAREPPQPDLPEGKDPDAALPSAAPLRSPSPPATPPPPAPADALAAPSAPAAAAAAASIKAPAAGSASDSAGFGGSWVEPGVFLAPAPFPPQPWPVLAAADKGSPGAGRGCEETLLDGEPIACFNVGGERRLCLPQILNTVLREFSLWQINNVCDELRIFCSRSTPSQLDALRVAGVLPHTATSCGLITHTDAQRLTQALLYAHPSRSPAPAPAQSQQASPQLRVYHTCFGKCKGLVWDELYSSASAACIECEECHGLFPPARFVCHAHRSLENQTIHWGFDAENWRTYLLLAKDQRQPLEKAELLLKAFKSKFDPAGANHKRKQVRLPRCSLGDGGAAEGSWAAAPRAPAARLRRRPRCLLARRGCQP